MSGASITLNTAGFSAMVRDLKRISGKSFEEVIKQQAAAVLKRCIKDTKQRSKKELERWVKKQKQGIHLPDGSRVAFAENGKEWFLDKSNLSEQKSWFGKENQQPSRMSDGRSFHHMNGSKKWGNARWAKWQMAKTLWQKEKRRQRKVAELSRGLTRNSWYQSAYELGLSSVDVGASKKVVGARPSNGQIYRNGHGRRGGYADMFFIEIINTMPTIQSARNKGALILQRAINGRVRSFRIEVGKKVFNDIEKRKQRYPGLFS